MIALSDLIARVEAATGPDWGLAKDIGRMLGWTSVNRGPYSQWLDPVGQMLRLPDFTKSLDAVLALIPPGRYWLIACGRTRPDEPLYGAQILDGEAVVAQAEHDVSPALALLAAVLRAMEHG